jgi:photosystem II stability/assembly factor-like uncharacterized protein
MRKNALSRLCLAWCVLFLCSGLIGRGQNVFNEDFLKFFEYRALGPAVQGARILDIEAPEGKPYTFYAVYATSGLWRTVNNGTTFQSLFDDGGTSAIGDFAIAPSDPAILWLGTGTADSGRLTIKGDGVYKSTDEGKTWKHMGLRKTRHIGRIAIHPVNPDIVYVAALGYHFSFNKERGLYKTADGGATWENVLFISEKVGVVDVAIDPANPETVYAASYDKWREPWHFEESGPETAIFKSTDAGKTWKKLTDGLPSGKLGRIGLAIYPKNTKILYAHIENRNLRPPTEEEAERAKKRGVEPQDQIIGGQVYRSEDGGETWRKMNRTEDNLGGGKWYGEIRVDPNDDQVVYAMGTLLLRSLDGGKTWGKEGPENIADQVHVDHHVVWIDPANSNRIILGNDGGLAQSYDFGKTWDVYENIPGAQYYAIGVDMDEPYNIYGGTQDTNSFKVPSNSVYGTITRNDWAWVGGGDGMYNQVDPNDSRWLYNDSQMGAIQRFDQKMGVGQFIRPSRGEDASPYRFNWTAPIHLSPHNSQIIYLGAEVLLRSLNRGDDWQEISPDLTTNDPKKLEGNIEFCNITTIAESPLTPGIIWVGTDDGKVQVTKDSGGTWIDRTAALAEAGAPKDFYVSRVIASHHDPGTAYAVKTGFQRDDFRPFIYKTTDFGQSWVSIAGNMPEGVIHVIVEDKKNPDLLFVGKEFGVWVTIAGGNEWVRMSNNIPTQDIFDLLIHPRENDLVVGTYGRGLYVTDITPLQEMNKEVLSRDVHLFAIEPKVQWIYKRRENPYGHRQFQVSNETYGVVINYYLKDTAEEKVRVLIKDIGGNELAVLEGSGDKGLNRVVWDMRRQLTKDEMDRMGDSAPWRRRQGELVAPGEYVVVLQVGDKTLQGIAKIRKMPGTE